MIDFTWLICAAILNSVTCSDWLERQKEYGSAFEADDESILNAIASDDGERMANFVREYPELISAALDGNKNAALHLAAMYDAVSVAAVLIKYEANVNALNSMGMTPLHVAAFCGCKNSTGRMIGAGKMKVDGESVIDVLVRNHAALDVRDGNDLTPLFRCVYANNVECARKLLAAGAKRDVTKAVDGNTPLHVAFSKGYAGIADALLTGDEDKLMVFLNIRNRSGKTLWDILLNEAEPNRTILIHLLRAVPHLKEEYSLKALKTFCWQLAERRVNLPWYDFRKYFVAAVDDYIVVLESDIRAQWQTRMSWKKSFKLDYRPSLGRYLRICVQGDLDVLLVILRAYYAYSVGPANKALLKTSEDFDGVIFNRGLDLESALLCRAFRGTYLHSLPVDVHLDVMYSSTSLSRDLRRLRTIFALFEIRTNCYRDFLVHEALKFILNLNVA